MKRTFWKKALAFAMSAALAVSASAMAFAEEGAQGTQEPNVLDTGDTTIQVDSTNIQRYLDGEFGSIDGKTLVLSAGDYPQLELGRATKYEGSNTEYYIGGISEENKKTFDEFKAIKNSGTWSASAYYVRNMNNVTIKAADGADVKVAGMSGSSGHVYGNVHDYVLDKQYASGSAYYLTHKWSNITFEGIQFTSKVEITTSSADTVIDGVTFRGCSFKTGDIVSKDAQGLRYYNENNNGNVRNLTVENCKFNNCFQGVYTQKINGVTVKNSSFDTTGHNAIAVQSGGVVNHKAVVITGNTFANIGDRIIRFGEVGADTQITIKNNTATNSGDSDREVIRAVSLAEGVTYHISDNSWGEEKTVGNPQFHDLVHHAETDSTCVKAGNTEYWECPALKKLYIDEQRTVETTIEEVTKDPAPHTVNEVPAKAATCTEPGNKEYWHCNICGKNYSDQATTQELSDVTVPPLGHDLKKIAGVDATTTATGVREHYECTRCDNWFWDADEKNLIADHKEVVLAKKTEETKDLSGTVVVIADSNVDVSVESNPELSKETKDAAQTVGIKDGQESADALTGNIAQIANAVDTDNALKETAKKKLDLDDTNSILLVVKPYVKVSEVSQEKSESDPLPTVIRMNIDLVYTVEAKNVSDAGAAPVEIQSEQKLDNNQIKNDTQIQIIVPTTGVWESRKVLIRHETEKHGVQYYFATVDENGYVTFTVPAEHGFSPFAVMPYDERTVTVKLDGEQKTYDFMAVVNGTTLPGPSKNNYLFKGWKFDGIANQHFNMTAELFEALLTNHADTTVINAVSVFEGPLSEHPEIEEAKKNGTWGVDENKPAATAKPAAAAAVTPVRSSIPKTSDDSNLMLWVCLMGLAALGLGGALYLKKRSNK